MVSLRKETLQEGAETDPEGRLQARARKSGSGARLKFSARVVYETSTGGTIF